MNFKEYYEETLNEHNGPVQVTDQSIYGIEQALIELDRLSKAISKAKSNIPKIEKYLKEKYKNKIISLNVKLSGDVSREHITSSFYISLLDINDKNIKISDNEMQVVKEEIQQKFNPSRVTIGNSNTNIDIGW